MGLVIISMMFLSQHFQILFIEKPITILNQRRAKRNNLTVWELAQKVFTNYGLGEVVEVKPLGHGYYNRAIYVKTTRGEYVLRTSRKHTSDAELELEYELIKGVLKEGINAAELYRTKEGGLYVKIGDEIFVVYRFLKGRHLDPKEVGKRVLTKLGEFVADLDYALSKIDFKGERKEKNLVEMLKDIRVTFEDKRAEVEKKLQNGLELHIVEAMFWEHYEFLTKTLSQVEKNLSKMYKKLPKQPIHGDITLGNILFKGEPPTPVGCFDWDYAFQNETRLWEFVHGVIPEFTIENLITFLKAYQEELLTLKSRGEDVRPLSKDEVDTIVDIFRLSSLKWLEVVLRNPKEDKRKIEIFEENLQILKNLTDNYREILFLLERELLNY